jgi:hypothetical protein
MMRARTALLACAVATSAAAPADPDWPCVQRLVPSLTAGTFWPAPAATSDWRADPRVAALVQDVTARGRSTEAGVAMLEQFVATRPGPDVSAQVFAGLVEQINAVRGQAIERLRSINRRQRALADATSRAGAELQRLPADAPAAQRGEIVSRRALMLREYEEVQRTIRYSCEIPVDLEARLGRFAQVLQRGLD